MLRHLRLCKQASRLSLSQNHLLSRVSGCHSLSTHNDDLLSKVDSSDDLTVDATTSRPDLVAQLDKLIPSTSRPPLELDTLPVNNPQLRSDYRMKQFVAAENEDLLQAIRSVRTQDECLALIRQNEKRMNAKQVSQTFTTLFTMGRSSPNRSKFVSTLISNPDFKRLIQLAVNRMRHMESNEVVSVFKCLTFLSISQKSLLFNGCLQMIRHQINELEADELVLLDFLFALQRKQNEEKNGLLEALFHAIPIVFESKIRSKEIDFTDLDRLIRYFSMAALRKVNGKYVNQLLLAIKTQQKNPEFDGRIALRVLNRIASISIEHDLSLDRELIIQVCQICTRKMTDSIRNQDSSVSMNGLVRLYSRVLSRNILQAFYNPQLIEHMIRHVNDQFGKWTLEEMYCLLYNLSGFGHYDKSLLEKFYFMFLENYESYMNQSSIKPSGLIFAYFTPLRFDKFDLKHLFNLVLNPKKMKDLHKDFDMLSSIVLNLCTLEVYEPIEVFEKFADYLHKESFYPITRKYTLKTLRVLLIEMQNNKFPSAFTKAHQPRIEQILDQVGQDAYFSIQKKSSAAFDLSQFIGRDYLISNSILTRSGFLLENVAIYDSSERKFVRVCDYDMDVKFLDDIKLAANQHFVHFVVGDDWYCNYPPILRQKSAYYKSTLQNSNVKCIFVEAGAYKSPDESSKALFLENTQKELDDLFA